jgi:hypothetical protein
MPKTYLYRLLITGLLSGKRRHLVYADLNNEAARDGIQRNHHAGIVLFANENATHSAQHSRSDDHALSGAEIRMRLCAAKLDASPDPVDFVF